jgi:hypothetical protein
MDKFIDSFSNRESALVIWIFASIFLMMFSKSIRKSILDVLKAFFVKQIIITTLLFILYVYLIVISLSKLGLWDKSLLKDTFFWVIGFGFVLIANVNKANSIKYFKQVIKDAIKWTIIVEFIVSFYTFSLKTELIILPVIVFSAMIQTYASFDPKHTQVETLFKRFLELISVSIFCVVVYKTIKSTSLLLTYDNLKSFILPLILTFAFMPFIYILSVYAKYEILNVRLNMSIKDTKVRNKLKKYILSVATINIDKIVSISENIAKPTYIYHDYSLEMVEKISKGKYVGSDEQDEQRL